VWFFFDRLTYERIEKNQIDVGDMNESMNKATSQMKVADEEPKVKDESVLDLIPPCNRETKDVNKVYNLSDILTEEELNDMDELAEQFLNVTEEEINAWRLAKKYMSFYQYHFYVASGLSWVCL
jgi:hypothetical protein